MTSRIMAVANQKGGVGKTTVTLGLAGAISHAGQRVLVIDMDPQSNSSSTLLPDYKALVEEDPADFYTTNDILEHGVSSGDIVDAIRSTPWPNVDLIPARKELANRDADGTTGVETRLRRMLRGLPQDTYDVVLLDCPPSVGKLTVNALVAAKEILLVAHPEEYSQDALTMVEETLQTINESYDHDIEVAGLVINYYEGGTEADAQVEIMKKRFEDKPIAIFARRGVLKTVARQNQSVFYAPPSLWGVKETRAWFSGLAAVLDLVPVEVPATAATIESTHKVKG